MKKLLLLVFLYALPLNAQPIVPAFTTGTVSSTTNTTTSINETITSTDYHGNSYEYTVTGLGVTTDGSISPNTTKFLVVTALGMSVVPIVKVFILILF